ncbi:MAG: PLDc N-terminal domain-containing protein, partial [Propionibacteriales bacterium]|nr:PLDc N-terminal domain-containing protein [Propionibacteriales bacterium]
MITTIDSTAWTVALLALVDLIIRVTAIIVIPRSRRPTAAMAWLLAIFFIPWVGVFLFLMIGSPQLPRARRHKQAEINAYILEATQNEDVGPLQPDAPDWFSSIVRLNRNLGAMPLTGGNSAELLSDYEGSIRAMAAAVDEATTFVHVEFYI